MTLKTHKIDDVMIVGVPGPNLDISSSDAFKIAMAPILASDRKVVLDLGDVEFMDSSALGSFLTCLRQLNAAGGDMKLCRMRKTIRNLFELVRMHRVFEILDTADEAAASFR